VVTETACHVLLVLVRPFFRCQIMWQVDAESPGSDGASLHRRPKTGFCGRWNYPISRPDSRVAGTADSVLDLSGQIVLPGLVNTHHHLKQTLFRSLPAAQITTSSPG
jgi:hypothetical protein